MLVTLGGLLANVRRAVDGLRSALPGTPIIGEVVSPDEPLLGLGEEDVPVEEAELIAKIEEAMRRKTLRDYPLGTRPVRRGAHAKHHGLCKAEFIVDDDLPTELRYGLFARPGARYRAWLRFSNAARKPQADSVMDGRGLAIKVRVADDATNDSGVQDFLLVNMTSFFARAAAQFLRFALFETDDRPGNYFYSLLPPRLRLHALGSVLEMVTQQIGCPFDADYYSVSPFQCGVDGTGRRRAVKFHVARVGTPPSVTPQPAGDDPLWQFRDEMERELAQGAVELRFFMQRQIDGRMTPVEDPTLEWTAEECPWTPCATLRIPQNDPFASLERLALGEVLSFNPWHHLPEHRPLGGINRIRKIVYQSGAALRWQMNGTSPPPDLWKRWEQ